MKYTNSLQQKGDNEYPLSSIDYLLGKLHTYAGLNKPLSTLSYEYHLIKLDANDNKVSTLKSTFWCFEPQPIELQLISEEQFIKTVKEWFFKNGELKAQRIHELHQDREAKYFVQCLNYILKVEKVFLISNLSYEYSEYYLDLGLAYDYFLLEGTTSNYLLYFRYDD